MEVCYISTNGLFQTLTFTHKRDDICFIFTNLHYTIAYNIHCVYHTIVIINYCIHKKK